MNMHNPKNIAIGETRKSAESFKEKRKSIRLKNLCTNAIDLPLEKKYDYVVVAGGTSGSPSAATLSANNSVLVLERGGLPATNPT